MAIQADGADGAQGEQGLIGPQGPQGIPGEDGAAGEAGADGDDGTSCSVTQGEGFATVSCTDDTSAIIYDGADGAVGEQGPPGEPAPAVNCDLEQRLYDAIPGFIPAAECVDDDEDGYTIENDCNDNNALVNPGQEGWFEDAADGSFDYNCSEAVEQLYPAYDVSTCTPGYNTAACGDQVGTLFFLDPYAVGGCAIDFWDTVGPFTQVCH